MTQAQDQSASDAGAAAGQPESPPIPPDRLSTLADGVFAIAMTLLVLELGVPAVTAAELPEALGEMWPEFLMYALSFLVLGMYWLMHHMIYDSIVRWDPTLAWLNIVYLMFAALIPFLTALIVEHGALTATALLYGLDMIALFLTGWAMWSYATSQRRLVRSELDEALVSGGRRMGVLYLAVLTVPLVLAFISPVVSMVVYALVVSAFVGFTGAGRWETVTVLRRPTAG